MRLRQIEYFVAVCEAGTFTSAAARLFVAQPSLSQSIRALEKELGAILVERSRHGVELSPAGRVFLEDCKAILARVESAKRAVRDVVEGRTGELHVLTVRSVAYGVIPPSVVRWHADYPGTVLSIHDFSHRNDLEDALRLGRGDVAIGPRPESWDGPVTSLGYEELRVVGPTGTEADGPMEADELAAASWIAFEPEQGMSEVTNWLFRQLRITPRVATRTGQVAAAIQLAVEGMGLAIVPENSVPAGWQTRLRRITSHGAYRELVTYTREAPTHLTQRYLSLLSEVQLPLVPASEVPEKAIRL